MFSSLPSVNSVRLFNIDYLLSREKKFKFVLKEN